MGDVSRQAPRYVSTAVFSALSDWVAFVAFTWVGVPPVGSQAVSRLIGGVTSFALNKLWTYESAGRTSGEAARFLQLYAFSYVLSLGLLHVLVEVLGAPAAPSKLVADGTCFAVNFVAMRAWVFARREAGEAQDAQGSDAA